jgi:prolyl-tRNA editing enzyme YbaK/EbsC (Cys-tRNA(Pro) deacylase)
VTVFGLPDGLPVLVDAAIMGRDRIVLGGGSRSWKVLAPPSILLTVGHAEIVEGLATPAPPRPEMLEMLEASATP